jgi:hypothetical protein
LDHSRRYARGGSDPTQQTDAQQKRGSIRVANQRIHTPSEAARAQSVYEQSRIFIEILRYGWRVR